MAQDDRIEITRPIVRITRRQNSDGSRPVRCTRCIEAASLGNELPAPFPGETRLTFVAFFIARKA